MPKPPPPIDPLQGPKVALAGRIVCMDDAETVLPRGVCYTENGAIVAVHPTGSPAPSGFEAVKVVDTRGTLFPGLIELHNHLAYNALRLWQVPKKYSNRDQWSGIPAYRQLVSGPMTVLGKTPGMLPALIRYVECKSLLGGVTTSQGVQLFSNAGIRRYYRGIVRNVEQTDDADLPEASTKIDDVEAKDAKLFLARLLKQTCFLLHLSEGRDANARKHFLALQIGDNEWAISKQLAGIHCAALTAADFKVLAANGGAMIWSPLSNLLLYGATADVAGAKNAGVRIGIGSDWSPSGSKNLLGELKVAGAHSDQLGGLFSASEIVALATRNAASILGWERVIGSLEAGKRADLLVIDGKSGDPHAALLDAKETDIRLVMINGVPRYGLPSLMQRLGGNGERVSIGGLKRQLYLEQATQDPVVAPIALRAACDTLADALHRLPELAHALERAPAVPRAALGAEPVTWQLVLDELHDTGVDLRPRLPLPGQDRATGPVRLAPGASAPLSQILKPLELDPLTVADDPDFLQVLAQEINLPDYVRWPA